MAAPANELQAAVYAALLGSDGVTGAVATRVYDRVPDAGDTVPFITIGDGTERPDLDQCKDISDTTITVNVWSEKQGGFKECKEIAFHAKRAVLRDIAELPTHALIGIDLLETRYLRDPDGITSRAVLTFEAMIEEN